MRVLLLALVLLLVSPVPARADDGPSAEALEWARGEFRRRLANAPRAREFPARSEWLNTSRPLTLHGDLAGKVVVLDFWCTCCINCIHVLPDLAFLEKKYAGQAVAVVGVHSAKFRNERDTRNIREAVLRYEITHPVVNDGDFAVWNAYGARSWPTFAIITPNGRFVGRLSGEGQRENLDAFIAVVLEHYGKKEGVLKADALPLRLERASRPTGRLAFPGKLCADPERKSLFVADSNHHRVVELDPEGRFKRSFGDGERGLVDGPPAKARFFRPQGLCVHDGALWVCDTENHALRRVDLKSGVVTTAAGTGEQGNHWKLTKRNSEHGPWPGRTTALNSPWDVLPVAGALWVAMAGSHSLFGFDPKSGQIAHLAGDLSERRLDARKPFEAAFAQPSGLTDDGTFVYVADSESSSVVRVSRDGAVKTLAGGSRQPKDLFHFGDEDGTGYGRRFQHCMHVLFHDGVLYVADAYNDKVKTVDPGKGTVATRWGDGTEGTSDDPPRFSEPAGLAVLGQTLYVADTNNHAIRTIDLENGRVATLALEGVPIPLSAARGRAVAGPWPNLPGTQYHPPRADPVRAGARLGLTIVLDLPEGWKLTAGAPSTLRLEVGASTSDVEITGLETRVEVPALEPGRHEVVLRLLYYVCQDEGECRVRSSHYVYALTAGPQGIPGATIHEAFTP